MPVNGTIPSTEDRPKGEAFKVPQGMYYVLAIDVDEAPTRDPVKEAEYGKSWIWKFYVASQDMKPVLRETDKLPSTFMQFTPDRLGINPNTKQPAKARAFLEALTRGKLPTGVSAQSMVNKALENGVAQALIVPDPKKPQYMTIGSMLPVDDATSERVKALFEQYQTAAVEETEEVPF